MPVKRRALEGFPIENPKKKHSLERDESPPRKAHNATNRHQIDVDIDNEGEREGGWILKGFKRCHKAWGKIHAP